MDSGALGAYHAATVTRLFAVAVLLASIGSNHAATKGGTSNALGATPLAVSGGKAGFTLLGPQETGITFTNTLEEWLGASNRVLYNGSGLAAGDFDNDGLPDIYFCSLNGGNTLYKNLGGFRFADVTEQSGLKRDPRFYRGAVFADINSDQNLDLLVCVLGGGVQCWINDGKGRFTDTTAAARTGSRFGSATLALADVDGNGSLDLYVANNRTDDIRDRGQVNLRMSGGKMVIPPELQDRLVVIDGQLQEYGEQDQLLMNDGRGRFTAVSWSGGRFRNEDGLPLQQPPLDWGLAAMFRDANDDGHPDLYVCNDFWTPDRFWINDGRGRFRAAPRLAMRNMSASSMGVDFADIDRDGDMDFFVVDMLSRSASGRKRQKLAQTPMASLPGVMEDRPQIMRNTLFVNRGDGTFAEAANYARLAASDWSWTPIFCDVDLDGYEDLLIGAGHVKDVQDLDALTKIRARQHSWSGFTNEVERQKAFTKELMEHMRLYPPLEMPIIAYRNRGDMRFEEVTSVWGTEQLGVHHAIAMADFDRDGDLDMAVNNLGSVAGIYRNNAEAPRLAVRLKGLDSNVQGIGAKVTVRGGKVPMQSQEAISGGRYMAGSEPLLMFAAWTNAMTIEVVWRSGKRSVVTGAMANHFYEIDEAMALPRPAPAAAGAAQPDPLFTDVSHLLKHTHHDDVFNDLARQPMLPKRLSQLGPGVSWFDIDDDMREDLVIGSGRGGPLACYRNTGTGAFERMTGSLFDSPVAADQTAVLGRADGTSRTLLIASSNYESEREKDSVVEQFDFRTKTAAKLAIVGAAGIGPMALADVEGDGDLDLFVGGRVLAGRYPEPTASYLYRFTNGQFLQGSALSTGMVSGAVWSDLTSDGLPELILAGEWGGIAIFQNDRGHLHKWNPPVRVSGSNDTTLENLTGWWNGITTGDLDSDGRMDIVAGNWGLNSDYVATRDRPIELYYGDVLERGVNDLIETEWDTATRQMTTRRGLDFLTRNLPFMAERFASHKAFSEAAVSSVIKSERSPWRKAQATTLASMVFLNRGDHFEGMPLPAEAQWAPAFAVIVNDFNGDGHEDVFLGQNFFATHPETPRLDGGRGLLLRGDGSGKLATTPAVESGIAVYGEQRGGAAGDFNSDGRVDLAVSQNGAATKLYENRGAKPGLRIRLMGPPGNPQAIGAMLRLRHLAKGSDLQNGFVREIHAGSGYWSQDGAVQVLPQPAPISGLSGLEVWVRWPGGVTTTVPVAPNAMELTLTNSVAMLKD